MKEKEQKKKQEKEKGKKGRMNHEWVDIGTMTQRRNKGCHFVASSAKELMVN